MVAVPLILLLSLIGLRDNLKFCCYPIVIANIIFALMLFVLSQIVILYSLLFPQSLPLFVAHLAPYSVLGLSLLNHSFYRCKYAKIDITAEKSTYSSESKASRP